MFRRGIPVHAHRDGNPKYENEPEEGEIIDDYDLIVSSDEEISMRQRIMELEAENEEIEQIDVISRSYGDKIKNNRAAQVPTDVSSISSTEFVTPQKRKRRKSKEHKKRHCHRQYPREHSQKYDQNFQYDIPKLTRKIHSKKVHCKRRQKLFAKKHKKFQSDRFIHKDMNAEDLTFESLESSDSSSVTDIGSCRSNSFKLKKREDAFNKGKYIMRDTLRMAVARNTSDSISLPNKRCLKDKLLKELAGQVSKDKEHAYVDKPVTCVDNDDDDVQVIENEPIIQTIDEDSTDSMEEKELRLIALKSAVLKKHMARKMRNAAVAYSPTDFDEILNSEILRPGDKMDSIDIVDLETEDSQQACVTVSPEASPQLIMPDDQEESQQMMDCKPVDMDIANSDSEDATIESWTKDVGSCIHKYSTAPYDFAKSVQYGFIMQKLHELPPPPPGVDDYEDVPPPSPYHMLYEAEIQDMDLDNEDFTENQQKLVDKDVVNPERNQIITDTGDLLQTTNCHIKEEVAEEDDEEEEALRALLLSKFQSPKNQKKSSNHKEVNGLRDKYPLKIIEHSSQNHCTTNPTEIILKEAVKRLKIHSQTEPLKEEKTINSYMEQNICLNDRMQVFPENCSENVLEKLRDRLSLYKNQSHLNSDLSQDGTEKPPSDTNEFVSNSYNEDKNVHTHDSDTGEIRSAIDISDITRRLQIIKENVLNSIPKVADNSHITNENFETSENIRELSESSMENVRQSNKPIANNIVLTVPTSNDFNTSLARTKTVEANFDVYSNQTTLKVTIKNNDALVSEKNDTADILIDGIHKENGNKSPEKLPLTNNGTARKSHLNNERLVEATCRENKSHAIANVQTNKPVSGAKSATDYKAAPQTKYSLIRATKIVKPNKVINNNFNLNQKQVSKTTEYPLVSNTLKSEMNNKVVSASDSSRLITSMDQIKHMCKIDPFIISLQNSSNESGEEEVIEDYYSLYKPLYDYNDNASPLSLNLESPSVTPLRSNSPIGSSAEAGIANSNVEVLNLKPKETLKHKKISVQTTDSDKTTKTPLAVRHLPAAAQTEYRNLVHRMKLLENKRKLTSTEENKKENISNDHYPAEDTNKDGIKSDTVDYVQRNSLVKKVLIKNASNSSTPPVVAATNDTHVPNKASKLHKSNVLRSYESLYIKFGAGIVNNLDKSLKLVEEAKKAKVAKIKLENRLKELKAEMDILQSKQKEEQQKISRIYPSICSTNEFITSLKQKRSKIYKAAISLGKAVKGDVYRLNNDLKEVITTKSKKLAAEIKTVNSLKALDIQSKNESTDSQYNAEQQIKDNLKKKIEHCTTNSEENNRGIEIYRNAFINSEIASSKTYEENGEEITPEPLLETDTCGNTEFQNLGTNDSKDCVITEDPPRLQRNTEFSETSTDVDSNTTTPLSSYKSPLEHLKNIDSNVDPNGVVCPYDLMGNCEDVTCNYIHISPKAKT